MMNRASFPFMNKTKPQAAAKRMKSSSREALGSDMSEAESKQRRSFIAKPSKKKFLKP